MAGIDDLAGDTGSAVKALQELDGVSVNRIGLMGLSRGGHIAPLAANHMNPSRQATANHIPTAGHLTKTTDPFTPDHKP